MKMYTCEKPFKTTLFNNGEAKRIEVKKGSDWFLAKKETQNRVVLCNNKIELIIAEKLLRDNFWQWG